MKVDYTEPVSWVLDTYRQFHPNDVNAAGCVTGKPVSQGGVRGRTEATGLGVYFCIREFLSYPEVQRQTGLAGHIEGLRVIVQGFGNVVLYKFKQGFYAAHFLRTNGAKILGVAEFNGGIFNEAGLDIPALLEYRKEHKTFEGFPGGTFIRDSLRLLEFDCDILVPAALEQQIHGGNAPQIKAKLIAEGANGPITPAGHNALIKNGVVIIPDLLCNAGGVTVSYFEWLKNLSHVRFGRMTKRWDETGKTKLVDLVESISDKRLSEKERKQIIYGASEKDLVYSGLEDTMMGACRETHNTAIEKVI